MTAITSPLRAAPEPEVAETLRANRPHSILNRATVTTNLAETKSKTACHVPNREWRSIDDPQLAVSNAAMDRVRIGRSGLVSSVLGLGGGSSGRFGLVKGTRSDALRLIRTALDLGIDFFDGAGLAGGVDGLLPTGSAAASHRRGFNEDPPRP